MEAVIGLLLMLLGVSHGVETCDGRQDGAQCYGALGGTVVLQLMDSASEIFRYQLLSNRTVILKGRKTVFYVMEDRFSFTPSDGTFRINRLSRTDAGEYTLEIFDSNGRRSEQRTLHLIIQAPVSSVQLVSECLSQGEMRVSCSSEGGDSPQYSWTLDGHTLTDAQLLSGNSESESITLKRDVSGQLVCSVRNNVSRIPTCGFVFTNCTLLNGMHILQRVLVSTNTPCVEPTTTLIPETQASTEGVETCDGRQDGAQCYGALGGTLVLQLMDSASEIYKYQLLINRTVILTGRKNQIVSNLVEDRFSFTPSDGTFRINRLSWTDAGEYTLEIFDSNGRRSEQRTLHLSIQGLETREASTEDRSQLICGVRAAVVILLLTGITVYFLWKKKKYQTAEGSADPRTMKSQENSVVMVEMRSSAAEV